MLDLHANTQMLFRKDDHVKLGAHSPRPHDTLGQQVAWII